MKEFFNKENIFYTIERILEHRLFKPISISIITTFLLINGFSFFKNYIEERQEISAKKREMSPIKIKIPHPSSQFGLDEEQIIEYRIKPGDTILKVLFNLGAPETDVFNILEAMKKIYDPRSINAGQRMFVKYRVKISSKKEGNATVENMEKDVTINSVSIAFAPEKEVLVTRNKDGNYSSKEVSKNLIRYVLKYSGTINNGLFVDGVDMGISPTIMMNMINLYSFDVDFQRDIKGGDKFEVLFESFYDSDSNKIKDGNILFSSLSLQRRSIDIYMHKINGVPEFFDDKGNSVRKSLLRTPINGARISSGFGMRRHPVLGYSKMHKGIDFAAPTGTPILAAGNGIITYYGRKGGYGNYTQIKHNNDYSTAYGHASRFVKGIKTGSKVRQGQVVAYVGSTGRSTGPHLHYEIVYKGSPINPAKVKSVSGVRLSGKELVKFNISKSEIDKYRKNTPNQNSR